MLGGVFSFSEEGVNANLFLSWHEYWT
jgi:hypothetical protein